MEFRFPAELLYPIGVSLVFPLTLFCFGLSAGLRADNAKRFFAAAIFHTALWALAPLALSSEVLPRSGGDWILGVLIWGGFLLLYLEVWALLSRGYTLAMLLVLLKSTAPLSPADIARGYRGGAGLAWIMQHRAGGLEGAGLVKRQSGKVALTSIGVVVARAYLVARSILGLRRTG